MYYPSSENKDADQLRGYREADLRLCFRLCRLLVFSRGGSVMINQFCFKLSEVISIYKSFLSSDGKDSSVPVYRNIREPHVNIEYR